MGVLTPLMFMPPCAFTLLHHTPRTVQRSVNPIPSITQTPLVSLHSRLTTEVSTSTRGLQHTRHWHTLTCQCTHLRSDPFASVSKSWHPSATVVVETRSKCQQQGAGAVSTPASQTRSKLSCLSHSKHSPPLLTTAKRQRGSTRCKPSSRIHQSHQRGGMSRITHKYMTLFSTHINGVACHVSHTST